MVSASVLASNGGLSVFLPSSPHIHINTDVSGVVQLRRHIHGPICDDPMFFFFLASNPSSGGLALFIACLSTQSLKIRSSTNTQLLYSSSSLCSSPTRSPTQHQIVFLASNWSSGGLALFFACSSTQSPKIRSSANTRSPTQITLFFFLALFCPPSTRSSSSALQIIFFGAPDRLLRRCRSTTIVFFRAAFSSDARA